MTKLPTSKAIATSWWSYIEASVGRDGQPFRLQHDQSLLLNIYDKWYNMVGVADAYAVSYG